MLAIRNAGGGETMDKGLLLSVKHCQVCGTPLRGAVRPSEVKSVCEACLEALERYRRLVEAQEKQIA